MGYAENLSRRSANVQCVSNVYQLYAYIIYMHVFTIYLDFMDTILRLPSSDMVVESIMSVYRVHNLC